MLRINKIWILLIVFSGLDTCYEDNNTSGQRSDHTINHQSLVYQVNDKGQTIKDRFPTPFGFHRVNLSENSFSGYLRSLSLKSHGSQVKYYNGEIKPVNDVYLGVVDLPIGSKNLHQCADAVMRLRAEYLYDQERYEDIHFNFTNGFRVDYHKWMQGYRIEVSGNDVQWKLKSSSGNSDEIFWDYLETIFMYAGTLSLEQEMQKVEMGNMIIGDVLIQGGSPGHAVIVVDMAEKEGEKIFLLAQSYMPAQEIQILKNPSNPEDNPWYKLSLSNDIATPEWTFTPHHLRRFDNIIHRN